MVPCFQLLILVTHVGKLFDSIKLDNVLLVPNIKKNLLSIGKLTTNYLIKCEFFYDGFTLKDEHQQNSTERPQEG